MSDWLDRLNRPAVRRRLKRGLGAALLLLLLADALVHHHSYSGLDGWFGFYALYALGVSLALVGLARWLHRRLARGEDYYED